MAPKILVLHGYGQNKDIMQRRIEAIQNLCGDKLEFVYVNGPIVISNEQIEELSAVSPVIKEILDINGPEVFNPVKDIDCTPRGWFNIDIDDALLSLKPILMEEAFEGVLGLSQGATVAVLLTALLENAEVYPPFCVDGNPIHPPMKFCVNISGLRSLAKRWESAFEPFYSTPTLHVIGENDRLFSPEEFERVLEVSKNKRVEYHDGDHFIPTTENWLVFLSSYLLDPSGDIKSPGPSIGMHMHEIFRPGNHNSA